MDKKRKKRKETYSKHKKQKNRLKKQKYFSFVRRICVLVRGSGGAGGTDRDRIGGNEYYDFWLGNMRNKNPHGTKTLASWGYAGGNGNE